MSLYGGFQGQKRSGGGETSINQRKSNITMNQTILDGDLNNNTSASDKVWHVLVAGNDITLTGVNLTLDRLTIRNGDASLAPYYPINFPLNPGQVPIYYHDDGGAIMARGGGPNDVTDPSNRVGTITLRECTFSTNKASSLGAAIAAYDTLWTAAPQNNAGFNIKVQNTRFIDHFGSFSNLYYPLPSMIGVLVSSGKFDILNSTFNDHNNPLSESIYYVPVIGETSWSIKNNTFLNANNGSFQPGGQMYILLSKGQGSIESNVFANNIASGPAEGGIGYGGAIYLDTVSNININSNFFLKNVADQLGSAVYVGSDSIINNLLDNKFINNSVAAGEAVYIDDSHGAAILNSNGNLYSGNKPK